MSERTWRTTAAHVVRQVLEQTKGKSAAEIRARLIAAYPFGERRYWPYKVWCSEVARQTGRHKTPTRKAVEKAGQASMGAMFAEGLRPPCGCHGPCGRVDCCADCAEVTR